MRRDSKPLDADSASNFRRNCSCKHSLKSRAPTPAGSRPCTRPQRLFQLTLLHFNTFREGQIVHDALQVPAEISCLIEVSNDVIGKRASLLRCVEQTQLCIQSLKK